MVAEESLKITRYITDLIVLINHKGLTMKDLKIISSMLFILCVGVTEAARDPFTRNEDISNTVIDVTVVREGDLYRYNYTVNSPTSNIGTITNFLLDLTCDIDFGEVVIPVTGERPGYEGNLSSDGKHVPIELFAGEGTSGLYAVTVFNYALWGIHVTPGMELGPVSILSTAPPGPRTYQLEPLFRTDPSWDYSGLDEDTPDLPWKDDFIVTGTVTGPACKIDDPTGDLFAGSGNEPFGINNLLTYSKPTKDPLYVKTTSEGIEIKIHYSESIQKQSFKAKLNGKDISDLFKPLPGTSETVIVSGPWKRLNKLKLSVLGVTDGRVKGVSQDKRPEHSWNTPAQDNAARKFDEFKSKDVDTFHIWMQP